MDNSLMKIQFNPSIIILLTAIAHPVAGFADSNNITRIEHPYVQPQEIELTLASLYQKNNDPDKGYVLKHKLSVGKTINEHWLVEAAISGKKNREQSFDVSSYEAELKWQITEQGEYSADYGILFSYENEQDIDIKGLSITLLAEKQLGNFITTANLKGIYEQGVNIENEIEPSLALQTKYRYKASFEPSIEAYFGELNKGIGPVISGVKRLGTGKKLKWEVGVILGMDKDSSDQTWRSLLEYEF